MRRISTAGLWVLFVVASSACNGRNASNSASDAAPESAAPSAVDASSAPSSAAVSDAASAPPVAHHRGLAGAFFRAAEEANLTDDEKAAIDKLEEPILSDPGPRHELAAFRADLVASIKAGRLDGAKLQADEAAVAKGTLARQDEQATALNALHQALTAEQRKSVVDTLRASQAGHEHPSFASNDAGVSEWVAHRLERMKSQLVLDLDQQKEVAAVLARSEPPSPGVLHARFEAAKLQTTDLVNAFEKDAFDAKKLDLSVTPGKKPSEPLERQVKYLGQLLPILTAGQRDRLATTIEKPRDRRGHGDSIAAPFDMGVGAMPR